MDTKIKAILDFTISNIIDDIKNGKELEEFSEDLHNFIEAIISDYAYDAEIEDYTPFC